MEFFPAIVLGIVQGLTEFLPVSSSGHLVLTQSFFPDFTQPGVLFDTVLHLATSLAVVFYFRTSLITFIKKHFWKLILASIPAGLVGVLWQNQIESLFASTAVVGSALLLTGFFNYLTDQARGRKANLSASGALIVGLGQALAIIPGISRSGTTIFVGTLSGVDKRQAAQFSFILSIPAILGANLLQIVSHSQNFNGLDTAFYAAGFVSAFIAGLAAIEIVMKLLYEKRFTFFAAYCFVLGTIVILV